MKAIIVVVLALIASGCSVNSLKYHVNAADQASATEKCWVQQQASWQTAAQSGIVRDLQRKNVRVVDQGNNDWTCELASR
ncbi:hypothetical protein QPR65_22560 (plasmid) [Enterobacter hormaechei]|uniref:hypothetical protein n=1 Tax=Enterobacter hormaechei TaxID=158836 RepID=UPI0027D2FA81|nr:hypothetical protein [Enterobacter hormaechei]WLZ51918.1 hypothetical protein QPR65_22560 [Enterobacter hormaechei]